MNAGFGKGIIGGASAHFGDKIFFRLAALRGDKGIGLWIKRGQTIDLIQHMGGNIFKFACHHIALLGKFCQGFVIIPWRNSGKMGDMCRRAIAFGGINMGFITQLGGRHRQHPSQLPAA